MCDAMSPADDIHIRPYEDRDCEQLILLVRELQAHEVELFDRMKQPGDLGKGYVDNLQRLCRDHAGEIIVLECCGRIAGYAAVLTAVESDDPDEVAYTYALVSDIMVTRDQRGKGLGKRLLNHCERHAIEAGATWLRITALAGNTGALDLYRKHGFADHILELEKPLH